MLSGQNGKIFMRVTLLVTTIVLTFMAKTAQSDERNAPTYNLYGVPGLVDLPTAESMPDAELATTFSQFGDTRRTTVTFQITPRLSGSFRYSAIRDFPTIASVNGVYYDRSFDLRYRLMDEGRYLPQIAVGLQDFIGTGLYGAEYIVATKTLSTGLKITGGLGWGRLGGLNSIGTTGTRPAELLGQGGLPTYDRWFKGAVSPFGGISYAPNDRIRLKAEYSPDLYKDETTIGQFNQQSPWNFGVDYRFKSGSQFSLYHAYGSEIGAQVTFALNPRTTGIGGGIETAPLPVQRRLPDAVRDLGWAESSDRIASAEASLRDLAENDGLAVEAVALEGKKATVRLRNARYGAPSQAIGRLARAMSRTLPASVETFVIVPVVNGMAISAITLQRSDLEDLENAAADQMLARTQISDAFGMALPPDPGTYPDFTWAIAPYLQFSVFDPDNPVRADVGVRASAKFEITPNLTLSGSIAKKLGGDLDSISRTDKSNLPRVRTDRAQYSAKGDPAIEYLQIAHYGRPAKDLYSRFTLGYLETMYAGASSELLWKPVNSRFALGAELNYIQRRDFDQLFGLQDNITTDPVTGARREIPNLNGHVSAYYSFGNGFHGQVDVGRYLAGDYGATLSLDREFANGWRVGAYATVTDASFEDFGEGSFDKGLRFTIPIATFGGTPSRVANTLNIQSLTRDGGARLGVNGRLYEQVRDYHNPDVANSWGRFWR